MLGRTVSFSLYRGRLNAGWTIQISSFQGLEITTNSSQWEISSLGYKVIEVQSLCLYRVLIGLNKSQLQREKIFVVLRLCRKIYFKNLTINNRNHIVKVYQSQLIYGIIFLVQLVNRRIRGRVLILLWFIRCQRSKVFMSIDLKDKSNIRAFSLVIIWHSWVKCFDAINIIIAYCIKTHVPSNSERQKKSDHLVTFPSHCKAVST